MNKKRLSTISHQLLATTRRGRFALVNRTFPSGPLADSENRARFGVRRCCAAFLVLSTIGYLSAVALAKADQLSAPARVEASAEARADRSAQLAPTWKPRQKEPLEKYDMPPMHIYRLETSPRMISQFGVFTSSQANVDANGQNIIGDAANECSISVDPTNPSKMAIGWRQFNDVNSNFRQGGWGYTTDGGVTWTFPGILENNGNLFIGGEGFSPFYCVRSSNAQIGNQTPTFDQVTQVDMGGELSGGGINPAGLDGMLFLAIDHSGGPTNNNIYMLASVAPPGRTTTDVMFVRSTDDGATFSAPVKVNDDPVNPNKWHWFGTFSVAPNGRLDAVWYDTRNASNNTDSQLFYSFSTDAGVTWSANVSLRNSFNPFEGYPNQDKIGDYITMVSDETGGNVAYSATFNVNTNTGQHEEDVYYVRVSPTGGPTPTPTPTPTSTPTATPTVSPTATPTVTPTITPTATPTATPAVTPTPRATPRPRPSPHPRPTPR